MPMIDFVRDGVVYTAAITLPVGIGVDQYCASGHFFFLLWSFEEIVYFYFTRRKADLAEYAEVVGDPISLYLAVP